MKRLFDITVSILVCLIFMPFLLLVMILIRFNLGSPIFFSQNRPGKDGKIFKMVKFRTMTSERDTNGELLPDSVRLTKFGRFLRATSIDELPELWNVLKGDMSLVGPRPLLVEYIKLYTPEQARRHLVRPGITGWAQINGRNAIEWEEKFKLDCWYVDNKSLWLDLKILFLTLKKVFIREGISQSGQATMEKFTGSN